jgi:hypothetical protein
MSRLSQLIRMSQFSPTAVVTRLRGPMRKGVLVALLVMVLLGLGVATGLRSPVAHAEPVYCITHQLASNSTSVWTSGTTLGTLYVYLYASYRTNDNAYCGHTWARAVLHEKPNIGAPWGTLYAQLLNCAGQTVSSGSIDVRGGGTGTIGQDYEAKSSAPYLECAGARAWFVQTNGLGWAVNPVPNQITV